jgi:hypothetical protein
MVRPAAPTRNGKRAPICCGSSWRSARCVADRPSFGRRRFAAIRPIDFNEHDAARWLDAKPRGRPMSEVPISFQTGSLFDGAIYENDTPFRRDLPARRRAMVDRPGWQDRLAAVHLPVRLPSSAPPARRRSSPSRWPRSSSR